MVFYLAYSPIFRKDGARTHNLSLLGKCFTQRQLGRMIAPRGMLFLKLLFLLLAASTGVEPVKWRIQSPLPYPLGYEAILLIRLFSSDNALWSCQFWRAIYQLYSCPPLGFMSSRRRHMLFRYKTNQVKPV